MDEEKAKRVEEVLRNDVKSLHRSLSHIADAIIFRYDSEVATCFVSENWVMYYGDWLAALTTATVKAGRRTSAQLNESVRRAAIEHEVHHIIRGHFERTAELEAQVGTVAPVRWNVAADLEINGSTYSVRAFLQGTLPGGQSAIFPEAMHLPSLKTAEWYYRELDRRAKLKAQAQAQAQTQGTSAQGKDQSESEQSESSTEGKGESSEEAQGSGAGAPMGQDESEQGADSPEAGDGSTREGGHGRRGDVSVPDEKHGGCGHTGKDDLSPAEIDEQHKRIQEAAAQSQVSTNPNDPIRKYIVAQANIGRQWQKALAGVLAHYIGKRGHGKKTYTQPPRRGSFGDGVIRPGEVRTHAKVAVVIDVSGSMQADAIAAAVNVVAGLTRMLGSRLHVTLYDDQLVWAGMSANGRDIVSRLPGCGGSTAIDGMIRAGASVRPEVVVLLSDCQGEFPKECPVPVVVGRINSEYPVVTGWGTVPYVRAIISVPLQPTE